MLNPRTHLLKLGERLLPLAARTPFLLQRLALERSLNQVLAEPLGEGAFEALEGRWMRLEVADLQLAWCLTCTRGRLRIAARAPFEVCIRGNWREFLLLASRQEDPDTLFFRRRLVIEGDTDLGLAIKNLIDSLDPDNLPVWLWRLIQGAGEEVAQAAGSAAAGRTQPAG
ncbi:SCP2 domain-containing protein [Azotobacter bryophylli]|uniref:Ubiquinone biosynthesis accessory factor UbiT n=1 Tax=Azotobacter bryophylli TaxID=1986537 RepID=A0ABV7AWA0_9GAMM